MQLVHMVATFCTVVIDIAIKAICSFHEPLVGPLLGIHLHAIPIAAIWLYVCVSFVDKYCTPCRISGIATQSMLMLVCVNNANFAHRG